MMASGTPLRGRHHRYRQQAWPHPGAGRRALACAARRAADPEIGQPGRRQENLKIEDFQLDDTDMAAIATLTREKGRLFDGDPRTHEEF
jgi:hypothetical protein